MTLVHSARLLDGTGAAAVDDAWVATDGARVLALDAGSGWREHAHLLADGEDPVDAAGRWLVPGFVDLHRHGGGGHAHEDGAAAVLASAQAHLGHGTVRGLASFVAADVDVLAGHLAGVADLVDEHPGLLLGSHLEGPFLAVARRGAHDPAALVDPTPSAVRHLLAAARGTLRQVTLDPRRAGAAEASRLLTAAGVVVAVGHTEAGYEEAGAAFDDGARLLTHAFNAMPGIHHRAPGPVVAALADPRVVLELILDGEHVHPQVAALLLAAAPGRVALVSDAMAAAATPPPAAPELAEAGRERRRMRLGGLDVEVTPGEAPGDPGRVVLAGTDVLAGSTLTLDAALRVGAAAGLPLPALVRAATSTPARVLGLRTREGAPVGVLVPGAPADLVLLDASLRVTEVHASALPVVAGHPGTEAAA